MPAAHRIYICSTLKREFVDAPSVLSGAARQTGEGVGASRAKTKKTHLPIRKKEGASHHTAETQTRTKVKQKVSKRKKARNGRKSVV